MGKTLTHYWGSHFKSARHAENMELDFQVLIDAGWNCHLVIEHEPENTVWLDGLRRLGVSITCIPRPRRSFDFRNILAIRHLCRTTRCTVFRCDNMHMSPLIGAFIAAVPVRVWCKQAMNSHYEACLEPGWRERVSLTTRFSAYLSSCVIAVSSAVGEEISELGFSPDKVMVLNNPKPEIKATSATREESRSALRYSDENILLVTVGRAEKVKGWDILLDAFSVVALANPNVRLLLVGTKDLRGDSTFMEMLEKKLDDPAFREKIHFTGHVQDMKAIFLAADVFVLPSRSEGCCLALLEALELSLPCVATRVGNAAEVLENTGAGILVPRSDPKALAAALVSIVNDVQLRAEMASRATVPSHVPSRLGHATIVEGLYDHLVSIRVSRPDSKRESCCR